MALWMKKRMVESQRRNGLYDFREEALDTNKSGEMENNFFGNGSLGRDLWSIVGTGSILEK